MTRSQGHLSPGSLTRSPHHTHPLPTHASFSVAPSTEGRGVCPQGKLCPRGYPLSMLPARGQVLMLRRGGQLSCHCASKEVDVWVNTQKQCQWEGRARQSPPASIVGFGAQPPRRPRTQRWPPPTAAGFHSYTAGPIHSPNRREKSPTAPSHDTTLRTGRNYSSTAAWIPSPN